VADEPQADRDGADDAEPVESSDVSAGAESPLEVEAEVAADYLEELLDIADLDGDIDTYIEGDRAHVSIVSGSRILVGAQGEVLDALQELTRLAVMSETGERCRLMLDIAGYREQRRKELMALAADAVGEEGRRAELQEPARGRTWAHTRTATRPGFTVTPHRRCAQAAP
jgi:spoIIIJ-associated protein